MRPAGPSIVEFYRIDAWPRMRRVLLAGPSLLTLGLLVITVSFLTREPRLVRIDAAVLGISLVAGGAMLTALGMHRILRDDVSLALRTDGLVLQSPGGEILVGWDDLESVRWDAASAAIVVERAGAEPLVLDRPFARITGAALAERIVTIRRRAAMNLIR